VAVDRGDEHPDCFRHTRAKLERWSPRARASVPGSIWPEAETQRRCCSARRRSHKPPPASLDPFSAGSEDPQGVARVPRALLNPALPAASSAGANQKRGCGNHGVRCAADSHGPTPLSAGLTRRRRRAPDWRRGRRIARAPNWPRPLRYRGDVVGRSDLRRFGPGPYVLGLPRHEEFWAAGFPFDVPAVRAIEDLGLDTPVTFLAGDNGAGKSTIVETIAQAMGFAAQGGELDRSGELPAVPRPVRRRGVGGRCGGMALRGLCGARRSPRSPVGRGRSAGETSRGLGLAPRDPSPRPLGDRHRSWA